LSTQPFRDTPDAETTLTVIGMGDQLEMVGIDAQLVVADVVYFKIGRDRAFADLVGHPMGILDDDRIGRDSEYTVAVLGEFRGAIARGGPLPAAIGQEVYLYKEAGRQGAGYGR